MKFVATLVATLISAAAVNACYGPGERNQGAPGQPQVDYAPCCDGQASAPKAGDWGMFCPGGGGGDGGGGGGGKCYKAGERNQGAPGQPQVDYAPCCDGQASVAKAGDWGMFCPGAAGGGGGGGGDKCYKAGERNQGAPGQPQVDYAPAPCCDGQASVPKAGDWGQFCPGGGGGGGGGTDCYAAGERNQGAPGFPEVEYKPCCDGQAAAAKADDWGMFCPGGGTPPGLKPGCRRRRRRRL